MLIRKKVNGVVLCSFQDRSDRQKALVEELASSSSVDADLAEKLLSLENKLAELEEEKGNLQLRLVEAEEGEDHQRRSPSVSSRAREEELSERGRRIEEMEEEATRMQKGRSGMEKNMLSFH